MASFLLEIFSEEIPARMQAQASIHLHNALTVSLKEAGLSCSNSQNFVTPRRVAFLCDGIETSQPDVTLEKKGPKTNAPQAAIDGFLKSSGLTLDKLEKRMVGKDETYFAVIQQKGQPTAVVLKAIAEKILTDFPWPKSMRWGSREIRWVRPLHSILCLFDGKVVPVEFGGVTAGNITYGHRFLAPEAITITDPKEYGSKLKAAKVLADAEERKAEILKSAEALAAKHGLSLKRDDGLLTEVTGLVEWPTMLLGSIDAKFMDLPPEVLISEMRAHQKYFALLDKQGVFSDKFIITSNMITSDGGKAVLAGNERVLRARLSDGRFFWDQDRKRSLSDWAKGLEGITFHAKIGTIAQKVERVTKLAVKLAESPSLREAAATKQSSVDRYAPEGARDDATFKLLVTRAVQLCKADLTTGMVGEFPELQGVMGRYYALAQKEDASVADAIRDHYLPLGPDSPVPTKPISICVALADKLDTLISMFAAGEKPTGSKDPFALRRAALGIIRIILENNLRLPLKAYLSDELLAFFSDRLSVQLKDKGIRPDIIKAIMAGGDDDLVRVTAKTSALQEFLATEDGKNLLAAYRRAGIVAIEEKKTSEIFFGIGMVDALMLSQPEEKNLFEVLERANPTIAEGLREENYNKAMATMASLRQPVDAFLDKVLVNAEDKKLRKNRLQLLAYIREIMHIVVNFSLIEG